MKKNIFAVLVFSAMVLFGSFVFAFDSSAVVTIDQYGNLLTAEDGDQKPAVSSASESVAPLLEYVEDTRRFRGAGEWLSYIPFSFEVSWGMDGSVQFYEAVFLNSSDIGESHWNLLTPGTMTPTWGGFYKIVSIRSDEDVFISGQTPTIKIIGSLSYLDLRGSPTNVMLLAGESNTVSLPKASGKYYYGYGALFICSGQTISAEFMKEKLGDSLVGVVICDRNGFLSKYKSINNLTGYNFNGNEVPVMVFKYRK